MHSFLYPESPDLPENPDTLHVRPDKSIGIDEVRQIQHFLSRKPLTDHNTVIIHNAHLLTLPAQHALLKTLEEPPGNSLIYLITQYPDSLLPTILSRVQLVSSAATPPSDLSHFSSLISQILSAKVGDRLKVLDAQAFTRESFSVFLDQFEYYIHKNITHDNYTLDASLYTLVSESRKYLKSNCNLKLILDNFALNLTS